MAFAHINAPIVPGESIGEIKLDTHISELFEWLNYSYSSRNDPEKLDKLSFECYGHFTGPPVISYSCLEKAIFFQINVFTGRIFNISCHEGYRGKFLGRIGIGSTIGEAFKVDNSLKYYSPHNAIYSMNNPGISFEVGDLGDNDVFELFSDTKIEHILIGSKNKLLVEDKYFSETESENLGIKSRQVW